MSKRVFDSSFKRMAVELSDARGSVIEAAIELGVDPGRISKWRQQRWNCSNRVFKLPGRVWPHAIRSIIRRKYRVQTTDSNHGYAIAENYRSCFTLIEACSMLARNSKSNLQV